MTLFRKKTADEMQSKILDTIQEYRESLHEKQKIEEKVESSRFKAIAGMLTMSAASLGAFGVITVASSGLIAAPLAAAIVTASVPISGVALAYAGVNHLVRKYHESKLSNGFGIKSMLTDEDFVKKAGSKFDKKINNILSQTSDHKRLQYSQLNELKKAIINDNGTSLDDALKAINLPDTKHKKVFKENVSGQLEASLEKIIPQSFYSTRKESLKTGLGLTIAMGGAVAAVGGLSAASLMVTGLGVIGGVGALAWSGIRMAAEAIENRQIKKQFANKNDEDVGTRKTKLSV